MGAITTLSYAQLYNCLKSVDMLNKCKRLSRCTHAVLHKCLQHLALKAKFLKTLCRLNMKWMSQSMPLHKTRKCHRIFFSCKWSTGYKLRSFGENILSSATTTEAQQPLILPLPPSHAAGAALCVGWRVQALPASPPPAPPSLQPSGCAACLVTSQQQQHMSFPMQVEKSVLHTKILKRWFLNTISFFYFYLCHVNRILPLRHLLPYQESSLALTGLFTWHRHL